MTGRSFLNTSHQTIRWFAQQNEHSQLDLRPPFQRRPVWLDEQKAFLIDTILRGYPVPEVYVFLQREPGADEDTVAVVDGQQRLRACLEFLSDGFAITFDLSKLQPLYGLAETPWFGKRFSELSDDEKQRVERYKLIVRDLEDVTEGEIRHLFHRLNQSNFVLNAQELRFSMYEGGLLKLVEALVSRKEWNQFGVFTTAQRRRMLDSEFISELVIGYLHWPQNKKDNVDHYYRLYGSDFPFEEQVRERFLETLAVLAEMFERPRMGGTRWKNKSDFYTIFLALARGRVAIPIGGLPSLKAQLIDFSRLVSGKEELLDRSPASVYRAAVTRAATDRGRRVRREDALLAFLAGDSVMLPTASLEAAEPDVEDELDDELDDEPDDDLEGGTDDYEA